MANLGPRAAQELGPVEAEGSHDAAATDGGISTSGHPELPRQRLISLSHLARGVSPPPPVHT